MMGSKSPVLFYGRLALLAAGVLYTLVCRYMAGAGEWYARQVYPVVSGFLSAMSSIVPFSLEEWLVVAAVSGLLLYPVLARRHKKAGNGLPDVKPKGCFGFMCGSIGDGASIITATAFFNVRPHRRGSLRKQLSCNS